MPTRKTVKNDGTLAHITVPLKLLVKRFSLALFALFILGFIIISQMDNRLTSFLHDKILDAVIPVLNVISRPVDDTIHMVKSVSELFTLRDENIKLKEQNIHLEHQAELAKQLEVENEELRKLLHFVTEPHASFVSARVVSDTSGPYMRSVIINAGRKYGLKKNQIVINKQGLVGRIIEANEQSARILLITDINSRIPVITGESRERAIVAGNNSDLLTLLYLPDDSKAHIGEMVVSSGDGEMFPPGLPIGVVTSITDKRVTVKPIVDWNRLEFVSIVNY